MPETEPQNPIVAETTNIDELVSQSSSDPQSTTPTVTETDVDTAVVAVPSPPLKEDKLISPQIL